MKGRERGHRWAWEDVRTKESARRKQRPFCPVSPEREVPSGLGPQACGQRDTDGRTEEFQLLPHVRAKYPETCTPTVEKKWTASDPEIGMDERFRAYFMLIPYIGGADINRVVRIQKQRAYVWRKCRIVGYRPESDVCIQKKSHPGSPS
jgi:hypothetical protein